ncbi:MAG: hypothetical protein KJ658_12050 [Proteobacteria bacterium]|nr:hypothetical protein [Pseudomonadota bacterium]
MQIDQTYIDAFEKSLNPVKPETSRLPFKILGYGEISSIFTMEKYPGIVFKRLPFFPGMQSAVSYRDQCFAYTTHLKNAGLNLPEEDGFITHSPGRPHVLYLAQGLFNADTFCHQLIHTLDPDQITQMIDTVLDAVNKVRLYNEKFMPKLQIAVDAQLSNWTWTVENNTRKLYLIDTSTPFYRIKGKEQLDVTLLIKSMPFVIRMLIHLINLEDVVARYYDYRTVFLDIIGNLIKEQAPDLIDPFIQIANQKIADDFNLAPISRQEVMAYYQKDKMIWMAFSTLRRIDRFVTATLLKKRYEFLLPGTIKR